MKILLKNFLVEEESDDSEVLLNSLDNAQE
jgi:hypothetical protein